MEASDGVMMRVAQTDVVHAIRWLWSRAWPARPFSDQTNSLNADRALNSISPGGSAGLRARITQCDTTDTIVHLQTSTTTNGGHGQGWQLHQHRGH
jgi:hypothetical protein